MADCPHPDLDAPLSEAEAAETRRVTGGTWYATDPYPKTLIGSGVMARYYRDVRIRHADGSSTFVCETFPDLAERIVHAVNGNAALVAEVRKIRAALEHAETARSRALLLGLGCDDPNLKDEILDALERALGPLPGPAASDDR